jgi:glycosyltransferase involved in cell wall biosynthesis
MGYPVICFDLGAQAERVRKYGCGIVVDDVSANSLMDEIGKLLEKPELLSELSRNAQGYHPPTPGEHFGKIIEMLQAKPAESESSRVSGEVT